MKKVNSLITDLVGGSVKALCSTGTTIDYGITKQAYIRTTTYQDIHNISTKTLDRYREKLISHYKPADHKYYFVYLDGRYWYTEKMLELRTYKKGRKLESTRPVIKKHLKDGSETQRSGWINWIKEKNWDYKCTARYSNYVSFDGCRSKMEKLHRTLCSHYKDATVKLFYSTESNPGFDGYHNHFLVSINGANSTDKMASIKTKIKSCGAKILECQKYNPAVGESFIRYMTKQIERNPECSYYLSNEC